MKITAILFFIMLSTGLAAQPADEILSWEEQNSETFNILLSVSFINTHEGWVVGGNGTILHTTDGGVEWAHQESGTYHNLHKVIFLDSNHGWVGGDNGIILSTSDGGQNWTAQETGTKDIIISIHFTDLQNGWAATDYPEYPYLANILHTNNGGLTWEVQNIGLNEWTRFTDVFFFDPLHGWAGGAYFDGLMVTQDGGITWQRLVNSTYFYDIEFISPIIGISCGGSGIDRTTNGGSTWQNMYLADNDLNAICCVDESYCYAVGEYGEFARSTNSGYTWTGQNISEPYTFYGISFPARDTGWVVGRNGKILHTTNGGFVGLQELSIHNFPNPFATSTTIEYEIDSPGQVSIEIISPSGQVTAILVNEYQDVGTYWQNWDADGLSEGVYFCRINADGINSVKKLILMK